MQRNWRSAKADDRGIAMVIVTMTIAMLTGLGVTAFVVSSNNLQNARRDRIATTSLSDAESGIGQAVAYIRANGVGKFQDCAPSCGTSNPWGQAPGGASPSQVVTLATGESYSVWFDAPLQKYSAAGKVPGIYLVHAIGTSRTAARRVDAQIQVSPFEFPLGVFAKTVQAGGTGSILTESLFSDGCVTKRSHMNFSGVDPVYNIPAAAHSNDVITDSNTNTSNNGVCPTSSSIHNSSDCNGSATASGYSGYPFDEDNSGGPLAALPNCYQKGPVTFPGSKAGYPSNSESDAGGTTLQQKYGYNTAGLTDSQLDLLRTASQEQGLYTQTSSSIPALLTTAASATNLSNPILFYDFTGTAVGSTVDINPLATYYGRTAPVYPLTPTSGNCTPRSVVIVVRNGDVKMNSNSVLTGTLFALGPQYGNINKMNGNAQFIGTVFAQNLDLTGTGDIKLDTCFLANLPGALLDVQVSDFAEVDR